MKCLYRDCKLSFLLAETFQKLRKDYINNSYPKAYILKQFHCDIQQDRVFHIICVTLKKKNSSPLINTNSKMCIAKRSEERHILSNSKYIGTISLLKSQTNIQSQYFTTPNKKLLVTLHLPNGSLH